METHTVINESVGRTVLNVSGLEKQSESVTLTFIDRTVEFYHHRECCESVWLEDFEGGGDIVGHTIVDATIFSSQAPINDSDDHERQSRTMTFYRISTDRGGELIMRWCGESSGYYSEKAFIKIRRCCLQLS